MIISVASGCGAGADGICRCDGIAIAYRTPLCMLCVVDLIGTSLNLAAGYAFFSYVVFCRMKVWPVRFFKVEGRRRGCW